MDIPLPQNRRKKLTRQVSIGGGIAALVIVISLFLSGLESAAPMVSRASVWVDTSAPGRDASRGSRTWHGFGVRSS